MKKTFLLFNFAFCIFNSAFPQAGEWVWIKGDSVPNQPGNFGVQGVPSPSNNPPSIYEPCEWKDLNGNFWLFGGQDWNTDHYGDLWKYDPVSNEWTWIKGPGTLNPQAVYGIQGVPSPSNTPSGTSYGQVSFTDLQGNLWLYDLWGNVWKYDISINQWTWMKGPGFPPLNQPVYGTQGVPDPANTPGARWECASGWTDNNGDLWIFGGQDGVFGFGYFNDLWRYSIPTNEWTWMKGDSTSSGVGNYGVKGIENAGNNPPARWAYTHWKDPAGNLWFFGGGYWAPPNNYHSFNDTWKYNPVTNNWTWMAGDSLKNVSGTYGIKCMDDSLNIPCTRFENRAVATDPAGNFLMFGGAGYYPTFPFGNIRNDLWKYCPSVNEWFWIGGDSISLSPGNWGILGVSSPLNSPKSRGGAVAWSDDNYHFYLFGGDAALPRYNDLWKFTIDTTCGVCPAPNSIEENNPPEADELLVFPNPTNSSLSISFSSTEKQTIELRIYNTLANQIYFSKEEIKGKFEKEINVEKLSSGIYFLQLKTKEGNINRKVIVNH